MTDARAGGAPRAVFLDRDGTIVEDPGFLHEPGKVRLLPGAGEPIHRLNQAGWLVITVSNQSGIARGLYDASAYNAVQRRLVELLAASAVRATVRASLARREAGLPGVSTYGQEWRLAGRAGQTVTIDVAAAAVDAYAFLLGPGFEGAAPQDDDSGGHCNAGLSVRLPRTGDYFIVVTSSERFATGAFTLSVVAGSRPRSLAPCDR